MAQFTLKVETAASKAQATQQKKDPLFYILPPVVVIAVLAVVYGVTPPVQPQPVQPQTTETSAAAEETADAESFAE